MGARRRVSAAQSFLCAATLCFFIIMQNAREWDIATQGSLPALLLALLPIPAAHLLSLQQLPHSFGKRPECTLLCTRSATPRSTRSLSHTFAFLELFSTLPRTSLQLPGPRPFVGTSLGRRSQ